MEHLNAAWNDFSTHNIQKDVMVQVSSNFLHDVEQNKTELATLGQEVRNFRVELHEHRFIDKEGNFRARALNQKKKLVRFCNYGLKNGHTPKWCRKKKCETKKYKKYDMKCPLEGIIILPKTMTPKLSTAAPNMIKIWTNLLIRKMATTQLLNINLQKKKQGTVNLTKSLHLNEHPFQGTVAWILMWHKWPQP